MGQLTWHDGHISDGETRWAARWAGNLVKDAIPTPTTARLVVRSGWVERDPDRPTLSWTAPVRSQVDQALETALTTCAQAGATLLLHPTASDLISDIPSTLGVLRKWSAQPLGIVLEPAALFTEGMIARAEDHLQRMGEALGEHPSTHAVLISNVNFTLEGTERTPIDKGQLPPSMLRDFADAARAAGKLVIMLPGDR